MELSKPVHNKYLLHAMDEKSYQKYLCLYSNCKRWGVRGIYSFLLGTELYDVVKEAVGGILVQYGKRRLSLVVIGIGSYVCAPAVAVVTNATPVIKICKTVYAGIGFIGEALEDSSQVTFLPLDLLLFGQPIPANKAGRYRKWPNITYHIKDLPGFDD